MKGQTVSDHPKNKPYLKYPQISPKFFFAFVGFPPQRHILKFLEDIEDSLFKIEGQSILIVVGLSKHKSIPNKSNL